MVQGIKFLSKKGFNPQNLSNQKRVWEAEQRDKEQTKQIEERRRQLQRERDEEELLKSRGELPRVSFLYDAPPGLEEKKKPEDTKPAALDTTSHTLTESHPDDDEATAAFRRLLAGTAVDTDDTPSDETTMVGKFGTTLQGTDYDAYEASHNDTTKKPPKYASALEQAAGRKTNHASTLEEQIQRFPVLAHAPRAKGMTATDVQVSFKPLGSQIRNVKCMACGVWGHSRGDRECGISGWDPFAVVATSAERASQPPKRRLPEEPSSDDDSRDGRKMEKKNKKKKKKKRKKSKHHKTSYA